MNKFNKLRRAGCSVAGAIRECLGMSDTAFAAKYGLPRATTTEAFNGRRDATDALIAALAQELGGHEPEWRSVFPRRSNLQRSLSDPRPELLAS